MRNGYCRCARTLLCAVFIVVLTVLSVQSQSVNMTQIARVPGGLRSVWGYTDSLGREYALACAGNALKIVDVTVPASPVVVVSVPTVGNDLKEVKTTGRYAYVVNQTGALQIVDLAYLPDSAKTVATYSSPTVPGQHTIWIDGSYAYLGMNGAGIRDYRILDISDPLAPFEVSGTRHPSAVCGAFADAHDSYVVGDIAYVANLTSGFMVLDISDRSSPTILSLVPYRGATTHSMRTTADGKYLFTTDELTDGHLHVWDVQDPTHVIHVAEYPLTGTFIHNVFLKGPWLFTSYYNKGLIVFDVTDPTIPVMVGRNDTYFHGTGTQSNCWDVYPYFVSGTIVTSDISNGLVTMTFNDNRAGYVEGIIADDISSVPISEAVITWTDLVTGLGQTVLSKPDGSYKLGFAPGTFTITISRAGYQTANIQQTISPMVINNLPILLARVAGGTLAGSVSGANISIPTRLSLSPNVGGEIVADSNGNFSFGHLPAGTYTLYAGAWGRKSIDSIITISSGTDTSITLTLAVGYQDNFELDLGWDTKDPADSAVGGLWERVDPVGTSSGGPVQPENDAGAGGDTKCYVTGQALIGDGAQASDVDYGTVTLISPVMDLTQMSDPQISYQRWYASQNSDTWTVLLSSDSGQNWFMLENTSTHNPMWQTFSFRVLNHTSITNKTLVRFVARDNCISSTNEAGVDNFSVVDLNPCAADSLNDQDGDGLCANFDNCPGFVNADQLDTDNDGVGDVCDACITDPVNDDDGDGLCGLVDNCDSVANPLQEDINNNGVGDACEGCCLFATGNVDCDTSETTDISDLTALIDHLFISLNPLCCAGKANVDGNPSQSVDISDLTALIDHLFITLLPTSPCGG